MNLLSIIKPISDHGNEIAAKITHYVGLPASGIGVATGVVNDTYTSKLLNPSVWTPADFAAIAGGVASIFLVMQIAVNIYFSIKERNLRLKREELEMQNLKQDEVNNDNS